MASQSRPIDASPLGTLVTGGCSYRGLSISSTAGADVVVYDGTSATGLILAQFTLAAKGDKQINVDDGTRCEKGIHVTATAAIQGHVRIG